MNDLFLKVDGVSTEEEARTWSINTAVQRGSVYKDEEQYVQREKFRAEWARLLSAEAEAYKGSHEPISDEQHCAAIARIADALSKQFGEILKNGRLRFGTSQKALNVYLKYLWALKKIPMPPHCPIDSVVLARVGIVGSWTKCDRAEEYLRWINEIRKRLTLAEWENEAWLRWRIETSGY